MMKLLRALAALFRFTRRRPRKNDEDDPDIYPVY